MTRTPRIPKFTFSWGHWPLQMSVGERLSERQYTLTSELVSVVHRALMLQGQIPDRVLGHNCHPLTWCGQQRINAYKS